MRRLESLDRELFARLDAGDAERVAGGKAIEPGTASTFARYPTYGANGEVTGWIILDDYVPLPASVA